VQIYILKGIHKLEGIDIVKLVLEGTNMWKYVLKGIRKLEGVNIIKPVLESTNVHKYVLKGIHKLEGVNIVKLVLESTNMCKYVLKGICKLEGVDITKLVLDMGINDKLCQAQNFLTQVESIAEMRLLLFFCSQCPLVNKGNIDKDDILSAFLLWPFIQGRYEQIGREGQPVSERGSLRLNCIWKRDKCGLTFFFSGELFHSKVVLCDIWCKVSKMIEWPKGYIDKGRGLDDVQGA